MTNARRVDSELRRAAKSALNQCLRIIASVQVRSLWLDATAIGSKSLLYALADETRTNVPSVAQLIAVRDKMVADADRLTEAATVVNDLVERMAVDEARSDSSVRAA